MATKKVVIITGSASGIGENIAHTFLQNGYICVFSDVNKEALELTLNKYKDFEASAICCDVTKEEEIKELIHKTKQKYGRLDIFVNNAGIQYVSNIEDFPTSKFNLMLQIMVTAPFLSAKYALPIFKEQNFGRFINIASINGLIGFAGKAGYNSSKHALLGLTKVIALECAKFDITCNAICPGYVDTPLVRGQLKDLAKERGISEQRVLEDVILALVPQKRLIPIEHISQMALYLSQPLASSITGQALVIDGGYVAQ